MQFFENERPINGNFENRKIFFSVLSFLGQNDRKMGNIHGTSIRVLKDTRCRIIWQVNAFEIYFVHLHYYLNLIKYILSCVKSSNPTFGPEISPK